MTNIIGKFDSETGNEVRNFAHIPWEEYLASKKYDKNIDNMCTNCIKEQKAKHGKITVECNGPLTIDNMVPEEVRHVLSSEELQLLREAYNPYEWAENNIDVKNKDRKERLFSKRWYQNQYINCSSKRKTIRSGRRIGKALSVDTPIPTPNGWSTMGDIKIGDQVFGANGKPTNVVFATDVMHDRECYEVIFSDGTKIKADKDHLWTVETKSIRKNNARSKHKKTMPITITTGEMIGSLKAGSKNESNYSIRVADAVTYSDKDVLLPIDPYLLGYWLGDGTSCTGTITVGEQDAVEFIEKMESIGETINKHKSSATYRVKDLTVRLKSEGLLNNKHIPRIYQMGSINQRLELLKGLMDSDGYCSDKGMCEFSSSLETLANDAYELICGLGMKASITRGSSTLKGVRHKDRFRIYINPKLNIFNLKRKSMKILDKSSIQDRRYIRDIVKIDSVPVRCITVDSPNSLYLASRAFIPTHNTFGVVLSLLHRMLTNNNYNILVVTPFDSQSEEVFTTMKKLLMNLEQPYDSIVKRAKESPYYIELRNGSRMKAFTVGNSGGGQIRGQPADILYVDEADLLTQKDFNSILAIMLDKPDTEMWVSSTPDGERQMYKLSQDEAFKEFHFPSSVLPHYNDKIDRDLRNQSDEMGYVQEVLAEFGASRLGVFQKYYIDMCAKLDYATTQEEVLARRGDFIITMGCDWNHDQIGTRICALAYDKKNNVFSIVEKVAVSKEGWTQTMAMEKIIQLNRKYRFEKIYIDEGYGATQAEMLKGFAIEQFGKLPKNHPDLYLSELRAINFSSKIEIKDPYTGLDSKKDIKPYMVETLNRLIEKMVIKLNPDEDKKLIDQLKGYEEKRGVTGRPTYYASNTAVGDHDLDALMLAALAYNLEFSEIFANLRTEIAIKVLSQEDIHGASTTHLRPSAAYSGKTGNDALEIRTRKRENCSPKSRVLYVGARRQDNNDEDNDIMRTSSLLYGKGTLLKKKGKRAQF